MRIAIHAQSGRALGGIDFDGTPIYNRRFIVAAPPPPFKVATPGAIPPNTATLESWHVEFRVQYGNPGRYPSLIVDGACAAVLLAASFEGRRALERYLGDCLGALIRREA